MNVLQRNSQSASPSIINEGIDKKKAHFIQLIWRRYCKTYIGFKFLSGATLTDFTKKLPVTCCTSDTL